MAPPKKRTRTSPANTAASSPPASTPVQPFVRDSWTPAQETALLKLLIYHKPAGLHKHFNMIHIHTSLQSQGLTHTQPSKGAPAAPIEHMLPRNIWEKLSGLYDLESLDEREEQYRLSNEPGEDTEEPDRRRKSAKQRDEFQFAREFQLDAPQTDPDNAQQADDLAEQMFSRRLKTDSEPASSPTLEERSIAETPSVRGGRGRGRGKATRNSLRQSTQGGRRGSRTTTATTSTAGDDEDQIVEAEDEAEAQAEIEKPNRSTRGSVREASKRGKGGRKKG